MAWEHKEKFTAEKIPEEMRAFNKHTPGMEWPRRGRDTFTCPKCGVHTFSGKEFCTDCGQKLSYECPQCGLGFRYEYQQAFCPDCGADLRQDMWFGVQQKPKRPVTMKPGTVRTVEEEVY
ncbi:MAG: zinc ribbon domain-containing protein [Phycisphaerae bacterium]|nr:zinc ribbon domain-containing protein [Phycisphaerae bacterium]